MALLAAVGVEHLAAVRRHPGSRRHPQFGRDRLRESLATVGIGYGHSEALGGRRLPRADSANLGWRNPAFRGYADYMGEPAFAAALERLLVRAATERLAIMCAEALPWRCHRWLLADALTVRGVPVIHLLGAGEQRPHVLTGFARWVEGRLRYPEPEAGATDLRATGMARRRG